MANHTPDGILGLAWGFLGARVLLSAAELDLFTLLSDRWLSAEQVAGARGAELRGTAILLDALASLELLEKRDATFHAPEAVARLLSSGSPDSVLAMILHAGSMWTRWSALTSVVRDGRTPTASPRMFDPREQEHFIAAMHVVGRGLASSVAAALDLSAARRLLDVGGASGTYAQAFLERNPELQATVFDLAPVIEMARVRLQQAGLSSRVTLVAGDFYRDELPGGHDVALLSAIIHQNSPEQNLALYRKIHRALEPGGRLVVRDHVMSPDRTRPPRGALFAVNMLVATPGGGTYSFAEIRDELAAAGFESVQLAQADDGRMNGLVVGVKPAASARQG